MVPTPLIPLIPEMSDAALLAYDLSISADGWADSRSLVCGDAQARLLVRGDHTGVVAIAGTQATSIGDWASNLQTEIKSIKGVYELHTGFYKSAQQILKTILAESELPACFAEGNYYFTGHSLGAASAAVLAVLVDQESDPRIEVPKGVIGFGSPGYLTGDCGLLWPCPVMHVDCPLDLVTHTPPKISKYWAKTGEQVFIDDKGYSKYAGSQLKRLVAYIHRFVTGAFLRKGLRGIKEHSMHLYRTRAVNADANLKLKREMLGDV